MGKLFKPFPVPGWRIDRDRSLRFEPEERPMGRRPMLFGRPYPPRCGEFTARLYDAAVRFSPTTNSRRWRVAYDKDQYGRPLRYGWTPRNATREYGYWKDWMERGSDPTDLEVPDIGEGEEHFRIPFGNQQSGYRDLNAQFSSLNTGQTVVAHKKPVTLITDGTNPLGPVYYSTIQSKVQSPGANGFIQVPPQSHFMNADFESAGFGQWIEPENQVVLGATIDPPYYNATSTLRVRLKHGISHLHLWCPSGEYREFDTFDKEHFKITQLPYFEAPETSLVIKTGWEESTQWDIYLVPQRVQMQSHWVDYYDSYTFFTHFVHGFHNIRNTLSRLPSWPVPYGMFAGDVTDIFGIDDWTYYVAQWRGPFSPGTATLHPRPVGFGEAGGEDGFDPSLLTGGIWEGPPAHGSDYSIEYEIGHRSLLNHNVYAREVISVFFLFLYSHSTPVGYYARLALQQPGDLCAVVKAKGTAWREKGGKFYVWQRALKPDFQQQRTINWGTFLWDFGVRQGIPADSQYSLSAALQLGGWA